MLVLSVLIFLCLFIHTAISQVNDSSQSTQRQLTTAVSQQLDFDGIGGLDKNPCGYKKGGVCLFCRDGYQLAANLSCIPQIRCKKFEKNECMECSNTLVLQQGDCLDKNCQQGPSRYRCNKCKKGFTINEMGICVAQGCLSFSNGICIECKQGRQLSNQICAFLTLIVINNNSSVNTTTQINSTNVESTTTKKITTIITTISEGNGFGGIGSNGQESTTIVKINRQGCLVLDDEGNCARCQQSYKLMGVSCVRKDSPCEQYSKDDGTCLKCKTQYSLINQLCILNGPPTNCIQYVNGTCLQCNKGYYFVRGYCLQVDPLCREHQKIYGTCISCYDGYVLVEGRCSIKLSVPTNSSISIFDQNTTTTSTITLLNDISIYYCLERNETGNCIKCYQRFYLRNNLCVRVNHLCKDYDINGNCTQCFRGYKLQDSKCIIDLQHSPTLNCLRYQKEANMCLECENMFFRHSRGICIEVLPFCKTYDKMTGRCMSCYMGFFLANGFCQIIPTSLIVPFCRNYNPMDPRVCRQCVSGYFLQSNRCLPVSLSCEAYDQFSGSCSSCLNSFILSEGNCLQQEAAQVLAPFCREYNKSGMCLACKQSYQIINFVCIRK